MAKVRVAEVVANILAREGIRHVFMVTGGGAMHLNDALGGHPKLKYVACHHEQACTMAADSYFRMSGQLAAVNVTTGPGGTNTITGVYGAYTDSCGMVVISGQVKWETLVRSTNLPLRQLGDQEVDIIKMVEGITKYAELVTDPLSIRYHLEKAIYLARTGRPGPVWLDIPIAVQATPVDESELKGFDPAKETHGFAMNPAETQAQVEEALRRLQAAKRPVVMVGGGIRVSRTQEQLVALIEKLQIPIVTCWNAHDAIWDDNPLYAGRPGSVGNRPGNFVVQNSDCLLVLGSRLNIRQISYNWESFARAAYKIMVDVDAAELKKPTLKIDLPIHADLRDFFKIALAKDYKHQEQHQEWIAWCKERVRRYPAVLPRHWETKIGVNPYCFVEVLFDQLPENEWVVTGDGTACVVTFQAAKLKKGQRLFTNSGAASMGFDLPAAIGAHFASQLPGQEPGAAENAFDPSKKLSDGRKRLICIAGDGSIQMNLQELQTLVTHRVPAKIFVLNNQGYHSIRQTQHNFFNGHVVGCGEESGLNFPSMEKISTAYGIAYSRIDGNGGLQAGISKVLSRAGIEICEVVLNLDQAFEPKLSSKKLPDGKMVTVPLEDMFPFLPREELKENMIIPLVE